MLPSFFSYSCEQLCILMQINVLTSSRRILLSIVEHSSEEKKGEKIFTIFYSISCNFLNYRAGKKWGVNCKIKLCEGRKRIFIPKSHGVQMFRKQRQFAFIAFTCSKFFVAGGKIDFFIPTCFSRFLKFKFCKTVEKTI